MGCNPDVAPEQLQIGQVIWLPGGNGGATNFPPSTGGTSPAGRNTPSNARSDTTLYWKVPADLIAAVIYQESSGNVNVNSTWNPNGGSDSGLMQVNQHTAGELVGKYPNRFSGLNGTARDVMLGASYLKEMYDTMADQDWGIALRAYNSGPNGVDKNNLRARPVGTGDSTYVDKVLRFWSDISQGNDLPADHYESVFGKGF